MHTFGAGVLFATPLQKADGTAITVPSPVQFGILQDVTIEDSFENKELYGANQYPVDIGRGKGKVLIKAKFANINAALFNAVYFGQTLTAGYEAIYNDLTGTAVPTGAGATSVHIVPPSTGVFADDLGVIDANGVPMTRVSSSPTGGQYSLAGATYSFSDIDVGKTVYINYSYTNSSLPATAQKMTVTNVIMGSAPIFSAQFMASKNGKTIWRKFPNCIATKLSSDYKNDDFTIPDFEAGAFADSSNVIQYYSVSE